ncbi:normal mucosa of esophagus-specific gene 1 protein-like isoform X1 [Centruroides sculpturatus]|uniref:normal mucosa of esophagus-specific gene 1 protein-like isoform X1 n=2 Tax=Centruroides sculpturatus TaxID=218467 RepID=UPI000C6D5733|nr:normal mucosa of esophagus-specific gene 1 protein-like isoform X1 [Centruroides sculpturatus]
MHFRTIFFEIMSQNFHKEIKSSIFGFKMMRKHPEVIPLVTIVGFAFTGMIAFGIYSFFSKSDVVFDKKNIPPWERIDPEKPQKLITIAQEWKKIPELEELRKELGPWKP